MSKHILPRRHRAWTHGYASPAAHLNMQMQAAEPKLLNLCLLLRVQADLSLPSLQSPETSGLALPSSPIHLAPAQSDHYTEGPGILRGCILGYNNNY